jgi:hypothetical protein
MGERCKPILRNWEIFIIQSMMFQVNVPAKIQSCMHTLESIMLNVRRVSQVTPMLILPSLLTNFMQLTNNLRKKKYKSLKNYLGYFNTNTMSPDN